jgi:uncharacterized protein with PQ loop repeat
MALLCGNVLWLRSIQFFFQNVPSSKEYSTTNVALFILMICFFSLICFYLYLAISYQLIALPSLIPERYHRTSALTLVVNPLYCIVSSYSYAHYNGWRFDNDCVLHCNSWNTIIPNVRSIEVRRCSLIEFTRWSWLSLISLLLPIANYLIRVGRKINYWTKVWPRTPHLLQKSILRLHYRIVLDRLVQNAFEDVMMAIDADGSDSQRPLWLFSNHQASPRND